ncbi:uncharacterized protein LOC111899856 [Lactuca sativa]|uniref:Armadillo repeat-containing protein 8 n=1 Tax=Lactuca sativa TaxID=4236 RepID=A0A9R1XRT3_LACSA|nr:uncharacterized protein LOC111899856 [Lactuca sativa]KAJ0223089.1 hypothetical protein LSAT_V11C200086810 [Lactuca sativa]
MPGSASTTHRPEGLIERLRSAAADGGEAKLKVLRELKNQIIGNRTKKLSYIKLGAVPSVVSILSSASSSVDCLLIQCAATIGSFACGVDAGVKAVLDAGAFPHLINLLSHSNEKVVDAGARALKMIYQSKAAPKYDFFQHKNIEFLISLLDKNNENVTGLGASIITHSCETNNEQKILADAGVLKKLINLLQGTTSQRESSLESFATIIKQNPEVITKFVGPENSTTFGSLLELTKDRYPRTRLLACICLTLIKNATSSSSSSYLQSVGIRTKLILVLLELVDDFGQVGDEALFTLSSFIEHEEDLQKLAFEANTVDKLCHQMQKESLQAKRLEGIFTTLGSLCSNLEPCRSIVLQSPKALIIITDALTHTTTDVRVAACICLKNVSRSVKYLSAGHFMTEAVIMPVIQLLYDASTSVQVAALCTVSNLVVDFRTHKSLFIQSGGVKQLVELSKSMDSTVKLNAVWALRNLMFLVDSRCKEEIFMDLKLFPLTRLISDSNACVQEQALGLVCNLVNGPVDSIMYLFTEGLLLNTVGRELRRASKPQVLVQAMYVMCNVASGKEFEKEAVMQQLVNEDDNNQSIIVTLLQSDVASLRTAVVWTVVNLTIPTGAGALARVVKLRNAGVVSQLKNMVNDPCLDVKLRVRTALGQSMTFGDFST